ncbi:MAG: UDP-N-acetylmuramate dehydrogenase [Candidatus Sungbacteria bacterium]|nr:UDP-N-acetylmuramate dehydrogenase [Candidatus Sungbacteria bacterium]
MGVNVQENIPLKAHTVFKIGGPARFFVEVKSREELVDALRFAGERGLPFFILGAGSNVLVSDKGFDGVFIKNSANRVTINGEKILADAGVMLPYLASEAARAGLSGFEWGVGIPGTVGGSVRGNSGCFGSEMKDVVEAVEVFDVNEAKSPDGRAIEDPRQGRDYKLKAKSCEFGYRDSIFKHSPNFVIISAVLALKKGEPQLIQERMKDLVSRRVDTQDIGAKCAGCIFKNVPWSRKDIDQKALLLRFPVLKKFESAPGISAGFLIDEVGLKGQRIGNAMISRKHANFFINTGDAKAEDVIMLVALVKERVHRKFGILLEEEIQYIGFE